MGAIGGLLGTAGGVSGTGIKAPGYAPITPTADVNQLGQSYQGVQNSLGSQQALLKALQNQRALSSQNNILFDQGTLANQMALNNGAANQDYTSIQSRALGNELSGLGGAQNLGNVYNQGNDLALALQGAGGVQNLSSALESQRALAEQQQGLASQYQNLASGVGPNPAQAALNRSTGQNIAAQAALMAGQRGAGSNVGLLARQVGQQGAATQQDAVGQAATLQAQQQLNALAGLSAQQQAIGNTQQNVAGIAGQQIGQTQAQQAQQASLAAQQIAAQQAQQQAMASLANTQVAQQQAQQNALAGQANTMANQQIGATTANTQANQAQQQVIQNALQNQNQQAVGMQGSVNAANAGLASETMKGQQSLIGKGLEAVGVGGKVATGGAGSTTPAPKAHGGLITNDNGPQSSFGKFITTYRANGGLMEVGGPVEAKTSSQKAVAKGDSYSNDKIPTVLSEKEIVIPRSITTGKDPVRGAADFVAKVLAKKRKRA